MASVYQKRDKIYISWYDTGTGKVRNRSTGYSYTRENMKLAKQIAKEFQSELNEAASKQQTGGIKRKTIQTAYDHFKELNTGKHKTTIGSYDNFFSHFCMFFPKDAPCSIITKVETERWLSKIRQLPKAQNTLYNYSKVLKKFLSFLFEYSYVKMFILNKDVMIHPEVKPITIFSNADILKIFLEVEKKNPNFKTMIYTLLYTGLRPSDIINMTVEDIDFEAKVLSYYSIKTKEHFFIPLHEALLPVLQGRCLKIQKGRVFDYSDPKNMGKALNRFLSDNGFPSKRYNLRTFRKTFISLAYQSGIDLAMVSKLVGHRQIATTAKYYNKINVGQQHEAINKFKHNTK
jgi:integrase/recombinase XerD